MKIERLDEYLTTATAVIVGVVVAYWCGLLAGGGRLGTLLSLFGGLIFAALLLALRQHVWMLIPATWILAGQLPEVKGSPALRDVITAGVAAATFMLVAFKVVRRRPKFTLLDFWVWFMLLYLATVWIRNPAGGLILNSDRIGGRAYLNTAVSSMAFWVLARAALPGAWWAHALLMSTVWIRVANGFLSVFTNIFPSTVPHIGRFYSGIDTSAYNAELKVDVPGEESTSRRSYLLDIGDPIARWLIARYRPLDLINPLLALAGPFYLIRAAAFALSLFLCLLTGFRGSVITLGAFFTLSTFLQQGLRPAFKLVLYAGAFIVLLVLMQGTVIRLPMAAQRALSFLPGRWDPVAVRDARASAQWRFFMWEQMLTTNKYIQNRWFGDGFGFSMRQFQLIQAAHAKGGDAELQESFMIIGQVHSGPISTIRFVGYVGLAIYMVLIIVLAREAWKLCKITRGTPYQALTFFFCLPVIYEPFGFVFIFGSYDYALPLTIFWAGLVKMLRNTVELNRVGESADAAEETTPQLRPQRRFARPVRPSPYGALTPRQPGPGDQPSQA